jgi:hypothetical protein
VVRQRPAKPIFSGSNPDAASKIPRQSPLLLPLPYSMMARDSDITAPRHQLYELLMISLSLFFPTAPAIYGINDCLFQGHAVLFD